MLRKPYFKCNNDMCAEFEVVKSGAASECPSCKEPVQQYMKTEAKTLIFLLTLICVAAVLLFTNRSYLSEVLQKFENQITGIEIPSDSILSSPEIPSKIILPEKSITEYNDGRVWKGWVDNKGLASGFGVLEDSISSYVGQMKNGQKQGFGEYRKDDGSLFLTGWFFDGEAEGIGKINYSNGTEFEGYFRSGKPFCGIIRFSTGESYVGMFSLDTNDAFIREGFGIETNSIGLAVSGYWKENELMATDSFETDFVASMIVSSYLLSGLNYPDPRAVDAWLTSYKTAWQDFDDLLYGHEQWALKNKIIGFDIEEIKTSLLQIYQECLGLIPCDFQIMTDCMRIMIGETNLAQIKAELSINGINFKNK